MGRVVQTLLGHVSLIRTLSHLLLELLIIRTAKLLQISLQ
jgi:hypothetical protein